MKAKSLNRQLLPSLFCWAALMLSACTADTVDEIISTHESQQEDSVRTMKMCLKGDVRVFDDASLTRAGNWTWVDGNVILLQFHNGSKTVSGHAVYSASSSIWEASFNGQLAQSGKCEVYYFEGVTTTSTQIVALNSEVPIYFDKTNGSYSVDDNELSISATLTPMTSRLRLRSQSNIAASIRGITTYTAYNPTTNTFSTNSAAQTFTTNSGYTPFIYCTYTNPTERKLILKNSQDGNRWEFYKTFSDNVLQTGSSGYLTIPTSKNNNGWEYNKQTTGTENDHTWVDLGLPSGLCWATTNVGATDESDYGNYYAWGETTTKSDYSWSTYKYGNSSTSLTKYNTSSSNGTVDNKTQLDLSDDAARAYWGGKWRMPTLTEFEELNIKCTWTWTTKNGHDGYLVTGPNGNSIFLPAAGYRYGTNSPGMDEHGDYWSSSLSTSSPNYGRSLYFKSSNHRTDDYGRYYGQSVRPVAEL